MVWAGFDHFFCAVFHLCRLKAKANSVMKVWDKNVPSKAK